MVKKKSVFVHIVFFNSLRQHGESAIRQTLSALQDQDDYSVGENLFITVRDNGSADGAIDFLQREFPEQKMSFISLKQNFGFAAGQNFGVFDFIKSEADYFLILNPDIKLASNSIKLLVEELENDEKIGIVTPKLLRADGELKAVIPQRLDAAGMVLTRSLRHFDRGSEILDSGQFEKYEDVFGGSGACLMLKRRCVEDLILATPQEDVVIEDVFPGLLDFYSDRLSLFDEAFFAYREDADLAWRAQLYGWCCRYVPTAVGYHRRVVLPENRSTLPASINRHSVRNRFLLQLNNYSISQSFSAFWGGVICRNLIVLSAICLVERSSFEALKELRVLYKRALKRRKIIFEKAKKRNGFDVMKKIFKMSK